MGRHPGTTDAGGGLAIGYLYPGNYYKYTINGLVEIDIVGSIRRAIPRFHRLQHYRLRTGRRDRNPRPGSCSLSNEPSRMNGDAEG
jgi:hypothetical protein